MKLAVSLSIVMLSAGVAVADEATTRYEKGLELYQAKEYEKAIVELKAAYELDPKVEHLYAYAQAERLSGDCEAALPLYEKLLEMKAPSDLAKAARDLVDKCKAEIAAKQPVEPDPAPVPQPTGSVGEPDDDAPRAWWKDPIGGALVGTGVIGLGVGVTFWILSSSAESDAKSATVYQIYEENIEKAQTRRKIAISALVAGGALTAGGVVRYLTLPRAKEPAAGLSFWFDGVDGGLVVAGEF